jgi:predicted dehydrogenase
MGTGLIRQAQKQVIQIKSICDINPRRMKSGAEAMLNAGWPQPKEYDDWHEMLQKEDLEAVIIATPLWSHADITIACLDAGKHVLCEKMMAKNEADCLRMIEAVRRNNRVLEIGYQRYYNPIYQAAYSHIVKQGLLGDVYHARLTWHRNSTWRKNEDMPAPDFDPSRWGYPDWEHLLNWRMYRRYSEGLMAELGSHKLAASNWFFDAPPDGVYAAGGIYQHKDGREVFDHVYATFDYSGGRTATFTSIQSNAYEDPYEMFMGTKGTLILKRETEAYLFNESESRTSGVAASPDAPPQGQASAVQPAASAGQGSGGTPPERAIAYRDEIAEFCAAIRTGSPLRCGPEKAMKTAIACVAANRSAEQKARLALTAT